MAKKPALSHCSSNISGQPISFRRFRFFFLFYFLDIPGDSGDDMGFSCSPRLSSFSGSSGFPSRSILDLPIGQLVKISRWMAHRPPDPASRPPEMPDAVRAGNETIWLPTAFYQSRSRQAI